MQDIITKIIRTSQNKLFFEASSFFEDQSYDIVEVNIKNIYGSYEKHKLFKVKTKHGVAHYEVDLRTGIIGKYVSLTDYNNDKKISKTQ